jgi:hypothetical protein
MVPTETSGEAFEHADGDTMGKSAEEDGDIGALAMKPIRVEMGLGDRERASTNYEWL